MLLLHLYILVSLVVSVPPKIDTDTRYMAPVKQEVKAGSTLILSINFQGTPIPRITWYKGGIRLYEKPGHISIETGDNHTTLTITGIELEEAGAYKVSVENDVGSTDTHFDVIVKGKFVISNSNNKLIHVLQEI